MIYMRTSTATPSHSIRRLVRVQSLVDLTERSSFQVQLQMVRQGINKRIFSLPDMRQTFNHALGLPSLLVVVSIRRYRRVFDSLTACNSIWRRFRHLKLDIDIGTNANDDDAVSRLGDTIFFESVQVWTNGVPGAFQFIKDRAEGASLIRIPQASNIFGEEPLGFEKFLDEVAHNLGLVNLLFDIADNV